MDGKQLEQVARAGLDFLVATQCVDEKSADCGRFPWYYDSIQCKCIEMSHNWVTGVVVEALLAGSRFFAEQKYLEAAKRGIGYIKTLQCGTPIFRESTPQTPMAHPRDALTAALACLDFGLLAADPDSIARAGRYAEWFVSKATAEGFPYWTVQIDNDNRDPAWLGSFHSGSAFFMARMFRETGEKKYGDAMTAILDFYNTHHLNSDGSISVILDRETRQCINGEVDPNLVKPGWITMHCYNDDFGALANLQAWEMTNNTAYREAAERYFEKMFSSQKENGGFGPADRDEVVPSAAGAIVIELMAAQKLGICEKEAEEVVQCAVGYLRSIQVQGSSSNADGGFLGVDENYVFDGKTVNTRTSAYAILALLKVLGEESGIYAIAGSGVKKG